MARIPRRFSVVGGFSVHKVWRAHNKENNIETATQKIRYLELMNEDLESGRFEKGSFPQALTLMSNHVHELSKVISQILFSNHMRRHHANYGQFFNKLKGRCGKVAQDRPHTTLIEDAYHEMQTVFYIHANPLRARMVKDARNYPWSTHRLYAFGIKEDWMRNIQLPEWYLRLGRTAELCQKAYRQLFHRYLKENGTTKKFFLRKRFFGTILWVRKREEEVSTWRSEHSPPN